MDYSKKSDFEINSAVHNAQMKEPYRLEFLGNDKIRWIKKDSDVVTDKVAYGKTTLKDYCNNPADAWPIITLNLMRITPIYGAEVIWLVSRDVHAATDENPLRAAMLVYLQLQEAK